MNRFSPFKWLAPHGAGGKLSIFIFHRVLEEVDPLRPGEPDVVRFETIVRFLTAQFRVMALSDAIDALGRGTLPTAAACITFDDGYADNLTLAAPVLRRFGAPATVFVATGYLDGGVMFNDGVIEAVRAAPSGEHDWRDLGLGSVHLGDPSSRTQAIAQLLGALKYQPWLERSRIAEALVARTAAAVPRGLMLTRDQLRQWRALGFEVGGHTLHHPILAKVNASEAGHEIGANREVLRDWLGEAPRVFAYPNGVPGQDYGAREVELARHAGYRAAVTTQRGVATRSTDPYQLPRFTPWDRSMWAFGLRCAQTLLGKRHVPGIRERQEALS